MSGQILIVDDHEVVRRGIRSLLSSRPGWKICGEAVDGLDAIEKARALRPSVILMDISMPRMNGIEAARIIRNELPESKVLIISQNEPVIARRQAQEVEAAGFIVKSDLSKQLLATVTGLIGDGRTNGKPVTKPSSPAESAPDWLGGGGTLGRLIREHDWSQTPLGPIGKWPQSLKTSVNLILNSQHPMWIGWGPDATFLYNDAYIHVLSLAKHPWALGRPAADVWGEIWDICGPLADKVFEKGDATFVDDVRLLMNRGGFLEETYYSFSYSPIRDESTAVAGLFCPSTEVTPKVINARRLRTLSELSANALLQKTTEGACVSVAATLAKNSDDIPFAVLYLIDDERKQAILAQSCGVPDGIGALTPASIELKTDVAQKCHWPVAAVVNTGRPQVVSVANVEGLPLGVGRQRLGEAMVLPVTSRGEGGTVGVLVAGVSPARKLDVEYRTFYELIAGQIATAIRNARATEEERKRLEALAEIDRAKTAFFSNVSHEFRTPLTLMLGPVEDLLAKSHTGLSPAAKNQLELVNRNGSRLLRLVNTLLDFSRIEAGRMQAIYQPTDLAAFTVELASVFRSATEKAGLQLELECRKIGEPVFVDRGMWEKIVLNLISNAFKFTFEGKIAVSLTRADNNVELRVRDTGVGIPAQELTRLFDRFHRIENTRSRTHEGSGIGLALAHELVKLHGGSVRVESVLGKGSTFIVSVPLGNAHLPADRIGGTRTLASTAMGAAPFLEEALRWLPDSIDRETGVEILPGDELIPIPCPPVSQDDASAEKRPLILVADDNADMRQYLVRLLGERYLVKAVPDGMAALAAVREQPPALVLSDVMMPNLDGFGMLRELRSDSATRTIPIILLSARAGEESRVEGVEQGADDYPIKPFSAPELLARVQTHLEMARVRKQSEEALLQKQQVLNIALAASDTGTFRWDPHTGDFLDVDENFKNLFGFAPGERLHDANDVLSRIHPEDRPAVTAAVEACTRGIDLEMEFRVLLPNAGMRWLYDRARVLRDSQGNITYVVGACTDVTGRKLSELDALAANAKFRAVFEQTTVFAGIMTLDGLFIDANRLCLEACGYRAEEVLGKPFWECGWWQKFRESQDKIRAATSQAAQGIPYREVLPYSWADGTERLVDFALYPIRDNKDQILFLHPTGVDITDLKQAEENYRKLAESLDAEVRLRTREVVQQSEQLRDLSSRLLQAQDEERRHIARELHDSAGQILAALGMTLSQAVQSSTEDPTMAAKYTEEGMELVQQLSQEIRTMSYLLHPPLLDETGLAEALRWYIQGLSERSGLEIAFVVSPEFQRLPREMELVMFRLVQECLTNIHRHSGSKSALIRVERDGGTVTLDVQDEGKGIAGEKLSEIQSQGSGVGIRGMRERVRQFGGQMNIESNKGTKVSFKFPIPQHETRKQDGAIQQDSDARPIQIAG